MRERGRQTDRGTETDRQTGRDRERGREREGEGEREITRAAHSLIVGLSIQILFRPTTRYNVFKKKKKRINKKFLLNPKYFNDI